MAVLHNAAKALFQKKQKRVAKCENGKKMDRNGGRGRGGEKSRQHQSAS